MELPFELVSVEIFPRMKYREKMSLILTCRYYWARLVDYVYKIPHNMHYAQLAYYKNLKYVGLYGCYKGDELMQLGLLETLKLGPSSGFYLTNAGLGHLTRLKKLVILTDMPYVDDEAYSELVGLQELIIRGNINLSNRALMAMTQLTWLDLHGETLITGDGIESLTGLRHLGLFSLATYVDVGKLVGLISLTTDDYTSDSELTRLTRLERLNIYYDNDNITSDAVGKLGRLTELTCSDILNGACLQHLTRLKTLRFMENIVIRDDDIAMLTGLTYLEINSRITWEGLKNLTNLEYLCGYVDIDVSSLSKLKYINFVDPT